jgi:hypothetical protein
MSVEPTCYGCGVTLAAGESHCIDRSGERESFVCQRVSTDYPCHACGTASASCHECGECCEDCDHSTVCPHCQEHYSPSADPCLRAAIERADTAERERDEAVKRAEAAEAQVSQARHQHQVTIAEREAERERAEAAEALVERLTHIPDTPEEVAVEEARQLADQVEGARWAAQRDAALRLGAVSLLAYCDMESGLRQPERCHEMLYSAAEERERALLGLLGEAGVALRVFCDAVFDRLPRRM